MANTDFKLRRLKGYTYTQLAKDLDRRGYAMGNMPGKTQPERMDSAIQKIIEHDAYYQGVNDARNGAVKNGKHGRAPSEPEPMPEPIKKICYFIRDIDDPAGEPYALKITPEQAKVLRWLCNEEIISPERWVVECVNELNIVEL